MKDRSKRYTALTVALLVLGLIAGLAAVDKAQAQSCNRTIVADVIALDQNYFVNRLGALNNLGMIYALAEDVFPFTGGVIGTAPCVPASSCTAGQVVLRPDKRPQPIALRVSKGDCLQINFTNLLRPQPIDAAEQPCTFKNGQGQCVRYASAHVTGLPLRNSIADDGSWVGNNAADIAASGLAEPGGLGKTYTYYALDENVYMITNMAATTGAEGAGGTLTFGLYGVVIVEPGIIDDGGAAAAEYYRGHVTNEDMALAACKQSVLDDLALNPSIACIDPDNQNRTAPLKDKNGNIIPGTGDQPIINYDAVYPNVLPFNQEGKNGRPILKMVCDDAVIANGATCVAGKLVHSDIHAVITGPNKGYFASGSHYRSTATNPRQDLPFRETASVFGDEQFMVQAFPFFFNDPVLKHTFAITKDGFVINYGGGAIGPEIVANRLGVGPMWNCPECKAEEFFLTSYAVGDPGMWVDVPANGCVQGQNPFVENQNLPLVNGISAQPRVTPINFQGNVPGPFGDRNFNISCENGGDVPNPGPKASVALYPDNPSNVHHSYIRDHFKFRNIHAGPFEHHIFHLHNNQWVFSPKSDNANLMDMQQIGPGSSYTMDITNEGAGNRNANPGDAIYHCHFYPHFAQGMWSALRMHDVFEEGTVLEVPRVTENNVVRRAVWALRDSPPAAGSRAYIDGEVALASEVTTQVCATEPVPPATVGTFVAFPGPGNTCPAGSRLQTGVDINGDGIVSTFCAAGMCDGQPVPALVPLPLYPMAPAPAQAMINPADPRRIIVKENPITGTQNPGFPFYTHAGTFCTGTDEKEVCSPVRGAIAGHRPPSPPLDIACSGWLDKDLNCNGTSYDGGLPRHVIVDRQEQGVTAEWVVTRFDINKELLNVAAEQVPESGSDLEKASFAYQGKRCHDTYWQLGDGTVLEKFCTGENNQGKKFRGGFTTNGSSPRQGAPHSDPCVDNKGNLLVKSGTDGYVTPEWNRPDCALARDDNTCAEGFKLIEAVAFGASLNDKTTGSAVEPNLRPYKISNIQIDLVLNKKGWHFPQQRIIALWQDIPNMYAGTTAPAPMVFRLNTLDCAEVWHSNLVPNYYEVDDFQIRTPTDIIAQHSHMTKFDVASSDGAANLWNYEDGTMSPGEIVERIVAINTNGGLINAAGTQVKLTPKTHPFLEGKVAQFGENRTFGTPGNTCTGQTCGSRTTVQRWLADPVLNNGGVDRGLGNVFTHDHFGPSTFQQLGLYATILAEPAGSRWLHNESGANLATRVPIDATKPLGNDGGPTSWQAQIIPPNSSTSFEREPFREFYFENSDFQQAYKAAWDGVVNAESFLYAVSPPPRDGNKVHLYAFAPDCPGPVAGGPPRPCPMGIGGADDGTEIVNYRNEPVGLRVFDPVAVGQAAGNAGDLGLAFASIRRADPLLNLLMPGFARNTAQCPSCTVKPGTGTTCDAGDPFCLAGGLAGPISFPVGNVLPGPQLTADVGTFDPATPMMRLYEGDKVKIRAQVGATEESHHFGVHGNKWLMNYADPNSGWRNVQSFGISEQFQFNFPVLGDLLNPAGRPNDYLYASNMSNSGIWNGEWGLMRAYSVRRADLAPLPNNVPGRAPIVVANRQNFVGVCPAIPGAGGRPAQIQNLKTFDVTAIRAQDIPLPTQVNGVTTLIYNKRQDVVPNNPPDCTLGAANCAAGGSGPLHDPTAIMYVLTAENGVATNALSDLASGAINPEPLIIRANANDCIQINLTNRLPAAVPDLKSIALTFDGVVDLCKNDDCKTAANNPALPSKFTFNVNDVIPSSKVGLHAQLVMYDPFTADGTNVGQNVANPQGAVVPANLATVEPGQTRTFRYYAGDFVIQRLAAQGANPRVNVIARPIEFGGTGLAPADKLKQSSKGLKGALVIEPTGVTCTPDPGTRAQATCGTGAAAYRDFVMVFQSDVNMKFADADPDTAFQFRSVPGFPAENPAIGVADDPEDSGVKAFNYLSDPYWFRLKMAPATPLRGLVATDGIDGQQTFPTAALYSNQQLTPAADPEEPIFTAVAGTPVRFHYVDPAGSQRSQVPVIHGHAWQRIPYLAQGGIESAVIGDNPESQVVGAQEGVGPASKWDFIPVYPAGGPFGVTGDYLYRLQNPQGGYQGGWGLFRVTAPAR